MMLFLPFVGSNTRIDRKCSVWSLWSQSQLHNGCLWAEKHGPSEGTCWQCLLSRHHIHELCM